MTSFALHGVGVSRGIAIGRAQLVSHATLEVAHYTIPPGSLDAELARFDNEIGGFLDVHWMILKDPTLAEAPRRIIAEQRCNAEWALTQQMAVLVKQFEE